MADNVGLLLAAIAQLEEKLSGKIDGNFKQMKQMTEEGLKGLKEEMTEKMEGVQEEMVETMEGVKEKIDEMGERMVFLEEKVEEVGHQMEAMNENMYKMEERIMEKLVVDTMEIVEEEEDSAASEDEGERNSEIAPRMPNQENGGQPGEKEDEMAVVKAKQVPTRRPRKRSKKIKFESTGTFTPEELVDFLDNFEKGEGRDLVTRQLFRWMRLKTRDWRDENHGEMWAYDSSRQPREFGLMKADTFLTDPAKKNLCFLQTHILDRICEMLTPLDFIELTLACRFLHWRMFAFCTCHAPYAVQLRIRDEDLEGNHHYNCYTLRKLPKEVYFSSEESSQREEGTYRGLFVGQPACLKKPFSFDTLEVHLENINYKKEDYDKCLPYIMGVRKLAKKLRLYFGSRRDDDGPYFDLAATNEFLKTINVTSLNVIDVNEIDGPGYLWATCDYTRKMEMAHVTDQELLENMDPTEFPIAKKVPWTTCPNKIGFYESPPLEVVMETFEKFLDADPSLEWHAYIFYEEPVTLLKYFFEKYDFEEKYASCRPRHRFYTTVETNDPGKRVKIAVYRRSHNGSTVIAIGREIFFDKWQKYYVERFTMVDGYDVFDVESDEDEEEEIWAMETAMEAEDGGSGTEYSETEGGESEDEESNGAEMKDGEDDTEEKEEPNR